MKKMSLQEIQNANTSGTGNVFIAYKGKVYDVSESSLWSNGIHKNRHKAGEDLTAAITAAPHGEDVLDKFSVIAELASHPPNESPKGLLKWLLNIHPHPVSVHFPIALIMTASFLTLLGWLFAFAPLMHTGFFNLVLGTIATPVAYGSGYLSFYYNYGRKWTKTFRTKQVLAILFFSIALIAIISGSITYSRMTDPSFFRNTYLILVFSLPPLVGATGYLGGTITFPGS